MSMVIVDIDENNLHRYICVMLMPNQCRAARAWLNMSQQDLADRASVSVSMLRDFEGGKRKPIRLTLSAIQGALESEGVEFIFTDNGNSAGISVASKG